MLLQQPREGINFPIINFFNIKSNKFYKKGKIQNGMERRKNLLIQWVEIYLGVRE